MEHLIDGDFASNNAGWGWCAGAGVGRQRHYLVFNPTKQSLQLDPSGEYIRTWVKELRGVGEEDAENAIHAPFQILSKKEFRQIGYAAPIVEHEVSKKRFLQVYKEVQASRKRGRKVLGDGGGDGK